MQHSHTHVLVYSRSSKLPIYNANKIYSEEIPDRLKLGRNIYNSIFSLPPLTNEYSPNVGGGVRENVYISPDHWAILFDLFLRKDSKLKFLFSF